MAAAAAAARAARTRRRSCRSCWPRFRATAAPSCRWPPMPSTCIAAAWTARCACGTWWACASCARSSCPRCTRPSTASPSPGALMLRARSCSPPRTTCACATAVETAWLAASPIRPPIVPEAHLLPTAHAWAREESPRRLDAKAKLPRRAGACPKSLTSLPLTVQVATRGARRASARAQGAGAGRRRRACRVLQRRRRRHAAGVGAARAEAAAHLRVQGGRPPRKGGGRRGGTRRERQRDRRAARPRWLPRGSATRARARARARRVPMSLCDLVT